MTFDEWYEENERRIYTGHMGTREAVMAGWYGGRESERERCVIIAENFEHTCSCHTETIIAERIRASQK